MWMTLKLNIQKMSRDKTEKQELLEANNLKHSFAYPHELHMWQLASNKRHYTVSPKAIRCVQILRMMKLDFDSSGYQHGSLEGYSCKSLKRWNCLEDDERKISKIRVYFRKMSQLFLHMYVLFCCLFRVYHV